jgi:hypothetical protein
LISQDDARRLSQGTIGGHVGSSRECIEAD